jgi:RNA polymerase subunit RPABC4/transcription elongation factor Spt4
MYTCRECEQTINQATEVCPYCGADLTAAPMGDAAATGPPKKSSATRITFLLGIVLTIFWAVAWFAIPWRLSGSKPEAQAHARDGLAAVQEALTAYQASEGSFPSSLEALGDRVRAAAQKAQSGHYTLQYTPGKPDADGRIRSYTLLARSGNFGYLNFYTDESGVFRVTADDRAATVQDPPLKGNL